MPEKVKGHYRAGKWIGPYMRAERDRPAEVLGAIGKKLLVKLHECCEGMKCCTCEKRLESGEIEPVGLGLREKHRLCGACLWEMSGVQAAQARKRVDSGYDPDVLSATIVEKYSALLDTQDAPPKDG